MVLKFNLSMNALENHITSTMSSFLYTSIYKPYIRENPMRDSSQLNKLRQELFILYLAFHELKHYCQSFTIFDTIYPTLVCCLLNPVGMIN